MTTSISHLDILTEGVHLFLNNTNDEALLSLANQFGRIIPDDNHNNIQHLKPKENGKGLKNSFSFNHGLSEFPYHTDTAFWAKPARLILMASETSSNCETSLIDTKELINSLTADQLNIFYNSVFILKTPNEIKFVSVLQNHNGATILRYDPNIMEPFNNSAKICHETINTFIQKADPKTINWSGTNVVVLDNWRFLHKRNECKNEPQRILKRIYINL
jgi:alpha-ketoglutarate-dependent taurine dioxygenase